MNYYHKYIKYKTKYLKLKGGYTQHPISEYEWGKLVINNEIYKDAKISPKLVEEWDWSKTNTNHTDGIQLPDVKDLFNDDSEFIILSTGMKEMLNISHEVKAYLCDNKIPYKILESKKAIKLFNKLIKTKKVGALIHSTC
jgi:hypothetical protein